MSKIPFDPYHQWLGIPKEEQPINHYRLLGVPLFEPSAEVIEAAANRQMTYVKQCGIGPYSEASQKILNELSTARVTLLNEEKKETYDSKLKKYLDKKSQSESSSMANKVPLIAGAAVAVVVIIGVVIFSLSGSGEPEGVDPEIAATELAENDSDTEVDPQPGTADSSTPTPPEQPNDPEDTPDNATDPKKDQTVAKVDETPETPESTPTEPTDPPTTTTDEPEPVEDDPNRINLLAEIDLKRDVVNGDFSLEEDQLNWQPGYQTRLVIPYELPIAYDLIIESTRASGNGLMVGLVVGGHQTMAVIDDTHGSGLHRLDGRVYNDNESQNGQLKLFTPDEKSIVVCSVRPSSVKVTCDEKTVIDWQGDPARFLELREWAVPKQEFLFVGGNAVHSISKLQLRLLTEEELKALPTETPSEGPLPMDPIARLEIPDESAQLEAETLIKDLFKDDYATAKKPEEKIVLAKTLLDQAMLTSDDPVSKYVLLREARELATDAGIAEVSLRAVEELVRGYEVDLWEAREETLTATAEHARFVPENQGIVDASVRLIDEAVIEERYELAVKLANVAVGATRKIRDKNLSAEIFELRTKVTDLHKHFATAQAAADVLKENADDPEANLTWGTYLCFQKSDWSTGLPLLAKSGDADLKSVIEMDLKSPSEAEEQIALADAWWDWIEASGKKENLQFRAAAQYWYLKAIVNVSGLIKLKVEKRLDEIGEIDTPRTDVVNDPSNSGGLRPRLAIAPFDSRMAKIHQQAWARYFNLPIEYTNSIGMKFRLIPPGEFLMGSTEEHVAEVLKMVKEYGESWEERYISTEAPQHKVRVTKPFYLGVYEVTRGEYSQMAAADGDKRAGRKKSRRMQTGYDRYPAGGMDYRDMVDFCEYMSEQDGATYRVSTEAEWEYACRAGTTTPFAFGDSLSFEQASFDGRYPYGDAQKGPASRTNEVGTYKPNAFGLYDMHGSQWEMCSDFYSPSYYQDSPLEDPTGPEQGSSHIIRSGDYDGSRGFTLRSTFRWGSSSPYRTLGFRVVREIDTGKGSGLNIPTASTSTAAAATSSLPKPEFTPESQRELAEWLKTASASMVLSVKGNTYDLRRNPQIPDDPFFIKSITMSSRKPISNNDLYRLQASLGLEELYLYSDRVSDTGLVHLKNLKKLKTLGLGRSAIKGPGLENLEDMDQLDRLYLGQTQITDEGLKAISGLTSLRYLDLSSEGVTDEALQHLTRLNRLDGLTLRRTQVTGAGFKELRQLSSLRELRLDNSPINDEGLEYLKRMMNLENLNLTESQVTDRGLKELTSLKKLRFLSLSGTKVTDEGLKEIAKIPTISELYLSSLSKVTDEGLAHLKGSVNLYRLSLEGTQVSDAGLKYLAGLGRLRSLYLRGTQVTAEGMASLKKALPNCRMSRE